MSIKLKIVDFLRGFSIFTIVLMHLVQSYDIPSWLMKATSFGGAGVHVFILCSGFGLYLSYLHKPLGYKDFIKKRFSRIYFPMAVVCLLTAVWMAYQGKDVLMPLLSNLLLFKMFVPELESSMGGQMWFISTIIQFYVAWPLIVKLMNVKRGLLYALLISLMWSTLVGLLGFGEERVWNSFFLQYLWEFCLGMKLAEVYLKRPAALNAPQWKILIPVCIVAMMMTGVLGVGLVAGSAIANFIGKNYINPLFDKNKKVEHKSFKEMVKNLNSERHPEALDVSLHLDDVASVGFVSGLKWIGPVLPMLYSVSAYRAGIGYRNGRVEPSKTEKVN